MLAEFFIKPSDLVAHETKLADELITFSPLQSTLGWHEMEVAMFEVITKQSEGEDSWFKPFDLGKHADLLCRDPDIGERTFAEYFTYIDGPACSGYFIAAEPLIKIHSGIARRNQK